LARSGTKIEIWVLRDTDVVLLETFGHRELDGTQRRGVVLLGIAKARFEGLTQAGVAQPLRALVRGAGSVRHGKRQRQGLRHLIVNGVLLEVVGHCKHSVLLQKVLCGREEEGVMGDGGAALDGEEEEDALEGMEEEALDEDGMRWRIWGGGGVGGGVGGRWLRACYRPHHQGGCSAPRMSRGRYFQRTPHAPTLPLAAP